MKLHPVSREVSPGIIEKWEQPDPLTVILHIRPGVKFHNKLPANGREVEARDIVYRLKSETGLLYPDANIPFPRKSSLLGMKDAVAIDRSTVRVTFESPSSVFIIGLSEARSAVIPEGLREHFGGLDSLQPLKAETIVTTGPFIPVKFEEGVQDVWERNPEYWDKPFPYVDGITALNIPDIAAQVSALVSGQIFHITRVDKQTRELVTKQLRDIQVINTPANTGWFHLGFNTKIEPFNDPRVRRALALVFDKPAFGKAIVGDDDTWRYPNALSFVYPEAIPQNELAEMKGIRSPTEADIAEAKELLSSAGYGDGFSFRITTADIRGAVGFPAVSEHLKDQTERFLPGVKVEIDLMAYTHMLAVIQKFEHQVFTRGAFMELSPVSMLNVFYHSKGGRNATGYSGLDTLLDQAVAELDDQKRRDLLRQIQLKALEDMPYIPTHENVMVALVHPRVHNYIVGSAFTENYWLRYAWLVS